MKCEDKMTCRKLLVLTVELVFPMQAAGLAFGNAVYMYLNLAFIEMLKAGTPVVVMAMLCLTGVEYMSTPVASSIIVMALGTLAASLGEAHGNWIGSALMLLAQVSEAGRCVGTQYVLKVSGDRFALYASRSPVSDSLALYATVALWLCTIAHHSLHLIALILPFSLTE